MLLECGLPLLSKSWIFAQVLWYEMAFRFWRRIRIAPGVTLNLSKSGGSLSFGPRGVKFTIGPRGKRATVGISGTKNDRAWKVFELFIPELDKEMDMVSDLMKAMFGDTQPESPTQSCDS